MSKNKWDKYGELHTRQELDLLNGEKKSFYTWIGGPYVALNKWLTMTEPKFKGDWSLNSIVTVGPYHLRVIGELTNNNVIICKRLTPLWIAKLKLLFRIA